jgi:hypothetical protein
MNIISASRRTDLPARYGDWLIRRVEAGTASYRNPFGGQIHSVDLSLEEVIAFVFWTRDASPFMNPLRRLLEMGYKAYFQYTLTGYGTVLEPGIPPPLRTVGNMKGLSDLLGPALVRWRYDPILLGGHYDRAFHLNNFSRWAQRLEGDVEICHTSFLQFYRKVDRHIERLEQRTGMRLIDPLDEEKVSLAKELSSIAASHGIRLVSCCYPLLGEAGLQEGRCVDPDLIGKLRPDLDLRLKVRPTRKGCGCVESRDIGAYDTCTGGCVYCYATASPETAKRKAEGHDPDGVML